MSLFHGCDLRRTGATSVYRTGSSVMLIHKASLPLGHLQISPGPTIKEKGNKNCRGVQVTEAQHLRDKSLSPASSVSSEMLRGCPLNRRWLPCKCLMLVQGLWALTCTVATPDGLLLYFDVLSLSLKEMIFPSHTSFLYMMSSFFLKFYCFSVIGLQYYIRYISFRCTIE